MPKSRLRVATPPPPPGSTSIPIATPVRAVRPYQAVSSLELIHARPEQVPHKLDWNEATVPPSPRVIEAITAFLQNAHHLNWYPVLNSTNLIERLAAFHGVAPDRLLVTNGSDDALSTICTTYLDPTDAVLLASPTYQHFLVFAQTRGAHLVHHYAEDPFCADPEGLRAELLRLRPRLLYLVNPNNPTGVLYTPEEIASLLAASPETLVIVDEAYSEFAGTSAIGLLHEYSNLIVTRTFSKAYGMAGLRIGYALAHEEVVANLQRVFNPKSVNVLAQVAAMAALEDQTWLRWYVEEVDASKALMAEWFDARGLEFRSTPANFVMVRFDQAPWVVRLLTEEGVYVRDRSQMGHLGGFVRYSVGTVEQTHDVLARTGRVLDRLAIAAD
ncbi:MAG: histidinol-phosphate aminotransferase family protein [Myxococcales bacterium]|nr:histidinol-phosphate aminotransferase family protein [Myxococcales bacterium]